jgi:hypothetical protein
MSQFEWPRELDAELRRLRALGVRSPDIAERMGIPLAAVWRRVSDLQLPRLPNPRGANRRGFWNAERDAKLRELWESVPQPSLRAIREAFDLGVTEPSISHRAINVLKLTPRQAVTGGRSSPKHEGYRSTFAGETPREAAETPAKRVVAFAEMSPCPYVDPAKPLDPDTGKVACCGVMVNRRHRRDGSRPSQYCKDHEARVLPMAAGRSLESGSRAGIGLIAMSSRGRAW